LSLASLATSAFIQTPSTRQLRSRNEHANTIIFHAAIGGGADRLGAVARLDEALAHHNAALPKLQEFILPAGTRGAAIAHVCRTVARRAERAVVALGHVDALRPAPRQYLNRLSDLLFVLARVLNRANLDGRGGDDVYWKSEKLARGAE